MRDQGTRACGGFRPPTDERGRELSYQEYRAASGRPMTEDELADQRDCARYGPDGTERGFVDLVKYSIVERHWNPGRFARLQAFRFEAGLAPLDCEHDPGDEDRR